MKRLRFLVIALLLDLSLVVCLGGAVPLSTGDVDALLGRDPVLELIKRVQDLSASRGYDEFYSILTESYRGGVPSRVFVGALSGPKFTIEQASVRSSRIFGKTAYAVIETRGTFNSRDFHSIGVIFLQVDAEGEWKLHSFPWTFVGLPEFAELPSCLRDGF